MPDTRHKNANWRLTDTTLASCQVAVLMDIRDELQLVKSELGRLNILLNCHNFTAIPNVLRSIRRNTAKPRKPKPSL